MIEAIKIVSDEKVMRECPERMYAFRDECNRILFFKVAVSQEDFIEKWLKALSGDETLEQLEVKLMMLKPGDKR